MSLIEIGKLLVPPILPKLARRLLCWRNGFVEWEYIPEGWVYAQKNAGRVRGWNVEDVLKIYKQKWPTFTKMVEGSGPLGVNHESALNTNEDIYDHNSIMIFAYALALAAHSKDDLSVLDWGGGIGHYYVMAKKLLPEIRLDYHIKDVPVLCEYGKSLFPKLTFYSDDRCFTRKYHFVFAGCSIHYNEDWKHLLKCLSHVATDYLLIATLPVVHKIPSFVFMQRAYTYGYNTEYLGWCLNQSELLYEARNAGCELVREFIYGFKPHIKGASEQNTYRGFLFRHRP